MTVADRMRKYRARKALRQAVERAQRQGLDAAEIVAEHLETLRLEREAVVHGLDPAAVVAAELRELLQLEAAEG